MKSTLLFLLALPLAAAEPVLRYDFESDTGAGRQDKRYCSINTQSPLSGKGSLEINTLRNSGMWNVAWSLPKGVLKPGHSYNVKFTCRLLGTNKIDGAHLLFLVRPLSASHGKLDAGMHAIQQAGKPEKLNFKLNIPEGIEDYSLQIHTNFGVQALIDDLEVLSADPDFTPAAANATAAKLPENLPSGAQEFKVAPPNRRNQKTFNAKDFGVTPDSPDNADAMQKMIAQIRRQTPAKLVMEPGVYRFGGKKGILFDSVNNFEFDGGGATFKFKRDGGDRFLLGIHHSQNVAFKNFVIDYDWDNDPVGSLAVVESVGADGKTATFKLPEYKKFPKDTIRVADLYRLIPGGRELDHLNPLGVSIEFYAGERKAESKLIGDNIVEVTAKAPLFKDIKPGEHYRMRHYVYDINGVSLIINRNLTLENITVNSAPGMGVLISGAQKDWQMLNCKITIPDGSSRLFSTAADALHMGASAGNFRLENCEIAYSADDAINLHSLNGYAIKTGEKTIRAINLNYHPGNYFQVKDTIELRNDDFSPTGFSGKITALKRKSQRELEITFDTAVPDSAGNGFVLFNQRLLCRNFIIKNNHIHDFPRGLLLAADGVTIENNRFINGSASGIKLETGYTFRNWSEGYGVNNVVIRNNEFKRVNPRGRYPNEYRPDIYVNAYMGIDPSLGKPNYPVISNLWIDGNTFEESTGAPVYVNCAADVVISGNKIVNRAAATVVEKARGAISVDSAKRVHILNNTWETTPGIAVKAGVQTNPAASENVEISGNIIQPKQ